MGLNRKLSRTRVQDVEANAMMFLGASKNGVVSSPSMTKAETYDISWCARDEKGYTTKSGRYQKWNGLENVFPTRNSVKRYTNEMRVRYSNRAICGFFAFCQRSQQKSAYCLNHQNYDRAGGSQLLPGR